jgi:hypothetical protein
MFRTTFALAVLAVVAAFGARSAIAEASTYGPHDPWYGYAVSFGSQASQPFITDTLAPWGSSVSAQGYRFTTDTLAPGGLAHSVQGYRFVTDTLAPGGGSVSVPGGRGFDWGDAGIGAAGMAGLMLGLLGSLRLTVSRRRVVAA